jgi:hypothetical protein
MFCPRNKRICAISSTMAAEFVFLSLCGRHQKISSSSWLQPHVTCSTIGFTPDRDRKFTCRDFLSIDMYAVYTIYSHTTYISEALSYSAAETHKRSYTLRTRRVPRLRIISNFLLRSASSRNTRSSSLRF